MVERLSPSEIEAMRRAGRCAAATLARVCSRVGVGTCGTDIDAWVREDTQARLARPSQLGYHGFPAAVCVSVNEVVCHGIPRARPLRAGDIVNIDVTSELNGFHGDTSVTLAIGDPSPENRALIEATRECLEVGIAAVRPGARLGDVGATIHDQALARGYDVVREYGGHGIGRAMHMAPHVSHVGRRGTGLRLQPGMCFTIEPMLTVGRPQLRVLDDGWTVVTGDGSPSAQFEHTILVRADGAEVLTRAPSGLVESP